VRRTRGFTLIELVVTGAIVGLLASAAMPLASMTIKRAKETELRSALRDIRSAIDAYKEAAEKGRVEVEADVSGYPRLLHELARRGWSQADLEALTGRNVLRVMRQAAQVELAAADGKHVLMEKPFTLDVKSAESALGAEAPATS